MSRPSIHLHPNPKQTPSGISRRERDAAKPPAIADWRPRGGGGGGGVRPRPDSSASRPRRDGDGDADASLSRLSIPTPGIHLRLLLSHLGQLFVLLASFLQSHTTSSPRNARDRDRRDSSLADHGSNGAGGAGAVHNGRRRAAPAPRGLRPRRPPRAAAGREMRPRPQPRRRRVRPRYVRRDSPSPSPSPSPVLTNTAQMHAVAWRGMGMGVPIRELSLRQASGVPRRRRRSRVCRSKVLTEAPAAAIVSGDLWGLVFGRPWERRLPSRTWRPRHVSAAHRSVDRSIFILFF